MRNIGAADSQQPPTSSWVEAAPESSASAQVPPLRRSVQTRQRLLSETRTITTTVNSQCSQSSGDSEADLDIPPTAKRARVTGARAPKAKAAAKGKADDDPDKKETAQHRRERRRVTLQARRSQHSRSLAELAALLPENKLRDIISKSTNGGEASTIDVAQVMLEQAAENDPSEEWNPFKKPFDKSLIDAVRLQPPNRRLILIAAVEYIKELQKFSVDVLAKNHSLVASRSGPSRPAIPNAAATTPAQQVPATRRSAPAAPAVPPPSQPVATRYPVPMAPPSAPTPAYLHRMAPPYHAASVSEAPQRPPSAAVSFTNPFSQPHAPAQITVQQQPMYDTGVESNSVLDDFINYDEPLDNTFAKLRSCLPAPEPATVLPGYVSLPYYY